MELYIFLAIIIITLLLIVVVIYRFLLKQEQKINELINVNNQKINNDMTILSQTLNNNLYKFQNDIVTNFKTDLNMLNRQTSESLYGVSKEMQQGMTMSFEKTNVSFNEVAKQLVSINETQKNLNSLSKDIMHLQNVLTDKKTRGIFGEVELYSILKSAYGINNSLYQTQYTLSNGTIADAVIFNAEPLNKIVIDSKFPLENYVRMYDEHLSKSEQNQARLAFKRDIKKHIDDIKSKYIIAHETADMAYLFIPAEAIFSEINGNFEDLVHYSYEAKVYLVSPTTLMAFITALKALHLSIEQNEKVDDIQKEYQKLSLEFERFNDRYESLSKSFNRMFNDFKDLDITTHKIMNRFEDIAAVKLEEKEDVNDETKSNNMA